MSLSTDVLLNLEERIQHSLEFLEAILHNILYRWEIYPLELFKRCQKYKTIIWKSRHPDLNEYIKETLRPFPVLARKQYNNFDFDRVICRKLNSFIIRASTAPVHRGGHTESIASVLMSLKQFFMFPIEPVYKLDIEKYYRSILNKICTIHPLSKSCKEYQFDIIWQIFGDCIEEDVTGEERNSINQKWIIDKQNDESKRLSNHQPIISYCTDKFKIDITESR